MTSCATTDALCTIAQENLGPHLSPREVLKMSTLRRVCVREWGRGEPSTIVVIFPPRSTFPSMRPCLGVDVINVGVGMDVAPVEYVGIM